VHNISGGYYTAPNVPLNSTVNGHPGEAWGWALSGGFRLQNFLLPKDRIEMAYTMANGAAAYTHSYGAGMFTYGSGNTVGMGYALDGVYVNGGSIQKSDSWKFELGYEHYWNAQWRTSLYVVYTGITYDSTAASLICGNQTTFGSISTPYSNCNPSSRANTISTRTAWNPHPSLEIGLDLIWWHLDTANAGTVGLIANGSRPAATYTVEDQDRYMAVLRVQKSILP
jgi:hypothetical protein